MKQILVSFRTDTLVKTTVQDGFIAGDPNVKGLVFTGDTVVGSDGYHTFDELYEHRYVLFIALAKVCRRQELNIGKFPDQPFVWRSKKHHDGSMFENMFIMGIGSFEGQQITYHLPIRMWDATDFAETMDYAPLWDGHTADDVIKRIIKL